MSSFIQSFKLENWYKLHMLFEYNFVKLKLVFYNYFIMQ